MCKAKSPGRSERRQRIERAHRERFEWTQFESRPCHLKEHESREKESPSETSTKSEPLLDAEVATQSRTTHEHKLAQIVAECELKNASFRISPQGAERFDRRREVINEALAEELQSGEQKKERNSRVTTAAPAPKTNSINITRIERLRFVEIACEVCVVSSQRQWAATGKEVSYRRRTRSTS